MDGDNQPITLESMWMAHRLLIDRLDREREQERKALEHFVAESRLRDEASIKAFEERFQVFVDTYVASHEKEHVSMSKAVETAQAALNQRLIGMNEFRQQIAENNTNFATKGEVEAIEERIATLTAVNGDKIHLLESAAITDRARLIDKETVDFRIRALERMIYMASGGMAIIMLLSQVAWLFKK